MDNPIHNKANKLIKRYAFGSSLTGFIPIPFVDVVGLIGVQRIMLMRLSKLYGIPFSKNIARALISTLMGGALPHAAKPMVSSTLKLMMPGIGTLITGASMAAISAGSTYAVGKVFQQHFESGGTLNDFDPEQARGKFEEELQTGVSKYNERKQA